jgi:hypothetical protein
MAKFPIQTARQELGVTPTTAVRFTGDARTGEGLVGQAIGQAALAGIGIIQRIRQRRQQMLDTRSSITADSLVTTAINENIAFRSTNADTKTWPNDLQERLKAVETQIGALDMSDDARLLVNTKFQAKSEEALSRSLIAETDRDKTDTREAIISDVVEQYTNGTVQDQQDAGKRFLEISSTLMDENEARVTLKTAIMAGQKARGQLAVSSVHVAAEAGNFEAARELAKNSLIPEPQQTTLRNMIDSAETAQNTRIKEAQQELVNKTTSTTIGEYFKGELTVATLSDRHEKGLIKDSEFKFMMKGLIDIIPEHSDRVAAGIIRRNKANFSMGIITRSEADKIAGEQYSKLDRLDREEVLSDLEDIEAKIIATAKSNAYSEGIGLMSRRFVGIQTEEELEIDLFRIAGLSEEEKKRINRRWTAEVNNRDLYERAIDDRFKEMREEGISDIDKYKSESLKILLQYQRRNRLNLVELEQKVREEQRVITGEPREITGPPIPLKSIDEMTTAEKQRQLERIRELRELAK